MLALLSLIQVRVVSVTFRVNQRELFDRLATLAEIWQLIGVRQELGEKKEKARQKQIFTCINILLL
jgi:hypothetical protein